MRSLLPPKGTTTKRGVFLQQELHQFLHLLKCWHSVLPTKYAMLRFCGSAHYKGVEQSRRRDEGESVADSKH
ncbi:MAG: hypothetical protein RM049_16110 [Nostoc sp. DedQUE04]|nr:hypothetical protein [Nostoc sp. DedQUE04]